MEKVASRFSETPTQNAMCEETSSSARCENTSIETGASVRASAIQALNPTVLGDDDDELSAGVNVCPVNPNQRIQKKNNKSIAVGKRDDIAPCTH